MERVAGVTRENAVLMGKMLQRQMRAYVHVNIGAIAQTDENFFQGTPELHNSGLTPARKVCSEVDALVYDIPLPIDFQFPKPRKIIDSEMSMSPRQSFTLESLILPRLSPSDAEIAFQGEGRRLYVWGAIRYEDIFGDDHETEFCYSVYFYRDDRGSVRTAGNFHPSHNRAA